MWHRDFPPEAREMWDVLAKALLLRTRPSCYVIFSADELRDAANTQAEVLLEDDGSIRFRIVQN